MRECPAQVPGRPMRAGGGAGDGSRWGLVVVLFTWSGRCRWNCGCPVARVLIWTSYAYGREADGFGDASDRGHEADCVI